MSLVSYEGVFMWDNISLISRIILDLFGVVTLLVVLTLLFLALKYEITFTLGPSKSDKISDKKNDKEN